LNPLYLPIIPVRSLLIRPWMIAPYDKSAAIDVRAGIGFYLTRLLDTLSTWPPLKSR
jgi:hypothetical protein